MKVYDKIFNSGENIGFKSFQLANGYISFTEILFEKEKIVARIEAKGHIEFFDCENIQLASFDIPVQTGGKETYNEVLCRTEENVIVLKLPIVEWVDNYPNCDGEYDRWDTKTIGYNILKYNLETKEITLN